MSLPAQLEAMMDKDDRIRKHNQAIADGKPVDITHRRAELWLLALQVDAGAKSFFDLVHELSYKDWNELREVIMRDPIAPTPNEQIHLLILTKQVMAGDVKKEELFKLSKLERDFCINAIQRDLNKEKEKDNG